MALAAGGIAAGAALVTAGPAAAVKEDCTSGYTCGWIDANFSGGAPYARNGAGDYTLSSPYLNSISSAYNHSALWTKWYSGASHTGLWCLPAGYQNQNLAGYPQQDSFKSMQLTSSSSGC